MLKAHYKIEDIVEKAENLSHVPTAVLNLMKMLSTKDVTVREIIAVIEKDQGLVARVFKVANSSFYGRIKKAENLNEAVVTMGLRGIRSFVIAQAVKHVLTTTNTNDYYLLWEHAVKVSIASFVLAKEMRYEMIEDALVGGLVHDIGKAFIESGYPGVSSLIYQMTIKNHITYEEAERSILDFNHAEIGALITDRWGFPQKIVDVIRYHHCADVSKEVGDETRTVIHIVKLANIIDNQYNALCNSSMACVSEKLSASGLIDFTADRLKYLLEEIESKWKSEGDGSLFFY
ncbi:MAG: HDOD domain-containing protein [Candidatus Brocadia sp.]